MSRPAAIVEVGNGSAARLEMRQDDRPRPGDPRSDRRRSRDDAAMVSETLREIRKLEAGAVVPASASIISGSSAAIRDPKLLVDFRQRDDTGVDLDEHAQTRRGRRRCQLRACCGLADVVGRDFEMHRNSTGE